MRVSLSIHRVVNIAYRWFIMLMVDQMFVLWWIFGPLQNEHRWNQALEMVSSSYLHWCFSWIKIRINGTRRSIRPFVNILNGFIPDSTSLTKMTFFTRQSGCLSINWKARLHSIKNTWSYLMIFEETDFIRVYDGLIFNEYLTTNH